MEQHNTAWSDTSYIISDAEKKNEKMEAPPLFFSIAFRPYALFHHVDNRDPIDNLRYCRLYWECIHLVDIRLENHYLQ
jgi:hypothetical protein